MKLIVIFIIAAFSINTFSQDRNYVVSSGSLISYDGKALIFDRGLTGNTYYVRPSGGSYGSEDGSSYADAWDGFTNINWNLITPSDTLYVCGTHTELLTIGSSGNSFYQTVIKGNYPSDAGVIDSEDTRGIGVRNLSKNYITLDSLTSIDATISCFSFEGVSAGMITNNCTGSGSGNQGFQHLNLAYVTHNDITATGNTDDGISAHDATIVVIDGATITGNDQGVNNIDDSHITITGTTTFSENTTHDISANLGTTEGSAWIDITGATLPVRIHAQANGKLILRNCIVSGETDITDGPSTGIIEMRNTLMSGDFTDGEMKGDLILYDSRIMDDVELYTASGASVTAENTFFNGGATHFLDVNSGTSVDLKYCIFKGMPASSFGVVLRAGGTATIDNCTFVGASNAGRGIFAVEDLTTNNNIFTDLDIGYFRSGGTSVVNNSCFYDNSTDVSGTVTQNDSQTGNPNLTDVGNNDFTLGVGSSCIGTGIDLGSSQDDYISTASWGNGTSETPTVTTTTQPASWYIGAYGE